MNLIEFFFLLVNRRGRRPGNSLDELWASHLTGRAQVFLEPEMSIKLVPKRTTKDAN